MSDDERLNRRSVLKLAGGTAATAGAFGVGSTAAAEIDFGQVERLQAAVGGFTTGDPTTVKRGATRITRLPTDAGTVTQFAGDETMTVLTSRSLVSDAAIREQVGLSDLDRFETTPSVAVLADETGLDYGRSSIAHEFVAGAELSTFLPSAGLVGLAAPTTNGVKLTSIRTARLTDDGVRPGPLYEAKQDDCDWVGSVAISCGLGGLAGGAAGCATAATIAAIKKAGTPACNPFY